MQNIARGRFSIHMNLAPSLYKYYTPRSHTITYSSKERLQTWTTLLAASKSSSAESLDVYAHWASIPSQSSS